MRQAAGVGGEHHACNAAPPVPLALFLQFSLKLSCYEDAKTPLQSDVFAKPARNPSSLMKQIEKRSE